MHDSHVTATVEELRARLSRRFGADLLDVRIFGSHARGEAHEDSDVDVFVLLEKVTWGDRREVLDMAGDLFVERGLLLSPTVMDRPRWEEWLRQERPLAMDIEREGVRP